MQILRILLVTALVPLSSSALPQREMRAARPARFTVLEDSGAHGVLTLAFGAGDARPFFERFASGEPFRLSDLPLPGGDLVALELRPVSAMEPGARAEIVGQDGSLSTLKPGVCCFSGRVVGGGSAFLAFSEREVNGYLYQGDELYFVATPRAGSGRFTLAHSSKLGTLDAGGCGFEDLLEAPMGGGGVQRAVALAIRTADVFIEADNEFRSRFASDQDCVDYVSLLLTAASEIYRRDIGTRLRIPDRYLRVWNTTPPWGPINNYSNLKNVYTWWQSTQNPQRALPRAAVHVLTSPVFGGTSRGIDGLCSTVRAYEISSLSGRFPYPRLHTDRYNWDLFVLCHEFGHTFGSPHSSLYSPPIVCEDGSGPDSGTLMSYCHLDYGIARVGMRFHLREQQRIRNVVETTCLELQAIQPGDYDGDGLFGPADLAALDEVLAQGFRSLAAEEVLDLDGNGRLDNADRELLAELVYAAPPAEIALRNGTGINPGCLESLGAPVLGTTWQARILAPGVGTTTVLVGYDLPLDGQKTARGELLVRTQPLGGTKLFTSTVASDGVSALHSIPLPLDPALFGRTVSFQALVMGGPTGDQYCNALDVVLSPYQ